MCGLWGDWVVMGLGFWPEMGIKTKLVADAACFGLPAYCMRGSVSGGLSVGECGGNSRINLSYFLPLFREIAAVGCLGVRGVVQNCGEEALVAK